MRSKFLRFAVVVVAAVCVSGCAAARSTITVTDTTDSTTPRTLGDLVRLRGPVETTYRWTSPAHGPGVVIWRVDASGELQRWDLVVNDDPALATTGQFEVINSRNGQEEVFGCEWGANEGDRSLVHTDCANGRAAPALMATLIGEALPVLAGTPLKPRPARTILKRPIPCYSGGAITDICVDSSGYLLYFAAKYGSGEETFEATSVVPAVQFFDWPAVASATPGPSPTLTSADSLGMPDAFHLYSD